MTIVQLPPYDLRVIYDWMRPEAVMAARLTGATPQCWLDAAKGPIAAADLLSTTRASGINLPDAAGEYQALDVNELPRTDRGLYANGQFTNKIAAYNFNPSLVTPVNATAFNTAAVPGVVAGHGGGGTLGLFGIVADAAKVATAGFGNVANGNVFQVDMTGDTVGSGYLLFENAVGNTNPHSWAAWVRNDDVDAILRMVGSLSYGTVTLTPGPEYSFVKAENWTPDATAKFRPQVPAGGVLRLFGMQLLESRFIPDAPIVTAGSAAPLFASDIRAVQGVRPDTNPEPFPGWGAAGLDSAFGGKNIVTIDRLNASAPRFITGAGVDADNITKLIFDTDNRFKLVVRKSGVDEVTLQTGAVISTGDKTIEWQAKPGDYGIEATGVAGDTDSDAETLPAGSTTLRIGSDFGALNPFNGWIKELQILKVAA